MEQRHQPPASAAQATFDYGQEQQQQQQQGGDAAMMEQQHQPSSRPGGSATIRAGGSATIGASGSPGVRATIGASARPDSSREQQQKSDIQMEQQHQQPQQPRRPGGSATIGAGGSATIGAGGSATIGAGGKATIGAGGRATIGASGSGAVPDNSRQQQQKDGNADTQMEQQHQQPSRPGGSVTISAGASARQPQQKSDDIPMEQQHQQPGQPQQPLNRKQEDGKDAKTAISTPNTGEKVHYGTFDPNMDIPIEQQYQQPSRPGSFSISVSGSGGGGGRKSGGGSRDSRDGGPPYRALEEQPEEQRPANDEENYRAWLTITFKHHFEPFESAGGMPMEEFQTLIRQHDIGRKHKLSTLFKQLDLDGNRRVSWTEFFNGMKYTQKSEVSKTDRLINRIIKKLTPAAKRKVRATKQEAANEGDPIPEESYLEAYNCRPPPIFFPLIFLAIWIFFGVYAAQLNRGPKWNRVGWESGLPYYSPLVFCTSVRQQAWRFISYMFLHDGYHHIVFNTIMGLLLGIPLETVHKVWRVGPVFLLGVLAGALASSIIDPKSALVGASGGVYSLIGAHYATVLMNWEELQSDWLKCRKNPLKFLLSGVMTLVYLTLFIALDFGLAAYRRYALALKVPMSVAAHVGGIIAGLLVGTPVLRNIDKKPWEGVVSIVAIVAACVLFAFGILWNIFYRGYPKWEDAACSNPSIVD